MSHFIVDIIDMISIILNGIDVYSKQDTCFT
jgi:hypothetical protein